LFTRTAILFDLDGTLVDTAPDLTGTLNDVLGEERLAPIAEDSVRHLIGHGAKALIERGLGAHGRTASPGEIEALKMRFIGLYAGRIARLSRPFPGAREALDTLISGGARLGIVTNKPERLTRLLITELGLAERFGVLVGFETAPRPKPNADPILFAAHKLKIALSETLMVGDSATDVEAARAAGVPVLLMRHGYTPVPADKLGADAVIDGFAELVAAAGLLLGRS
jgi:phosphoglycolate phosphatase